ncbi:MAG: RDD family protein [Candidatus Hydrogenedentes bacterium]|nr:RDD family protein [Candidatus Hydrogenedentota bacterium]
MTAAHLDELAAAGTVGPLTLIREGEDGAWRLYGAPASAGPGAAGRQSACVMCGVSFTPESLVALGGKRYCAACKETYLRHRWQGTLPDPGKSPRIFAKRAVAKIIDVNVLMLLLTKSTYFAESSTAPGPIAAATGLVGAPLVYIAIMTFCTGWLGGTPGKLVFGIGVVNERDEALDYQQALVRGLAEFLSAAMLGIGYLLALTDPRGQTLHDRICQTAVVARE